MTIHDKRIAETMADLKRGFTRGRRFNNAAVDLYPMRDGLIATKQTYWKQRGDF